jgi:hypothetical protein
MMLAQPEILSHFRPSAPDPRALRHAHELALARPAWNVRLAAWARAHALDLALIGGADPAESRQLTARALKLTSAPTRTQLAEGLERRVAAASKPAQRWWAPQRRAAILANASLLRELAVLLRAPAPLRPAGIAMILKLLSDGTGPMYADRDGTALALALERARAQAVPGDRDGSPRRPAITDPTHGRRPLADVSAQELLVRDSGASSARPRARISPPYSPRYGWVDPSRDCVPGGPRGG